MFVGGIHIGVEKFLFISFERIGFFFQPDSIHLLFTHVDIHNSDYNYTCHIRVLAFNIGVANLNNYYTLTNPTTSDCIHNFLTVFNYLFFYYFLFCFLFFNAKKLLLVKICRKIVCAIGFRWVKRETNSSFLCVKYSSCIA